MRRPFAVWSLVLTLIVVSVLASAGCGGDGAGEPGAPQEPEITGVVWQSTDAGGGQGSLLLVAFDGGDSAYDRASAAVTPQTSWLTEDGAALEAPPLRDLTGRRVSVTFTGPVAESYPVQATAAIVRVLEPLDVSTNVTPAGEPQVRATAVELERDETGAVTALVVKTTPAATRRIPVSPETSWLLATPSEFKAAPAAPLIGNGLEPEVHAHLEDGVADWIAVMLPR